MVQPLNGGDGKQAQKLPFTFDPSLYDEDIFSCEGDPCAYYIIQDGTAHPDKRCPYDDGILHTSGLCTCL